MNQSRNSILMLGHVRFDCNTGELSRTDGEDISLRPRSMAVLNALAENEGEVVSKDTLISSTWGSICVTDDSLTQCISDIRRTIGDESHRIIQTIPKVGYKLVTSAPEKMKSRWGLWGILSAVALITAFIGITSGLFDSDVAPSRPTIAVLPFNTVDSDAAQAYFTDGISKAITTNLSKFDGIFVVSSYSAFKFRNSDEALDKIAENLDVRYLLSGDIQLGQQQILINAQLIDTVDNKVIWAERYKTPRKGVFELEEELSSKIASTLVERVEIETSQWAKSTTLSDLTAYELVLRSEPPPIDRTGLNQANQLLDQAIALSPNFAVAHALRAKNYLMLWRHSLAIDLDEALQQARLSATKAIDLDNNSYQAYLELSQIDLYADQDHVQALANLIKALTINPNDADIMVQMATLMGFMNRDDEALQWVEKFYRQNPLHPIWYHWNAAFVYAVAGKNEEAIVASKKALAVYQSSASIRRILIAAHGQLNQWEEAEKYANEIKTLFPGFKLSTHMRNSPFMDPVEKAHYWELFRRAGLPD